LAARRVFLASIPGDAQLHRRRLDEISNLCQRAPMCRLSVICRQSDRFNGTMQYFCRQTGQWKRMVHCLGQEGQSGSIPDYFPSLEVAQSLARTASDRVDALLQAQDTSRRRQGHGRR
jgi:hypothetical protein